MKKESMISEARELVQEFTEQKGWTRNRLAKKLQITSPVLSHLDNNPDMVSEEMLLRIINHLRPTPEFKLVRTSNYDSIQTICRDAQQGHKLVSILGYPGAGKTTALYEYYRTIGNVYLVTCKNVMNRKQFFAEVLTEMGISFAGTVYDMVKAIVQELTTKESPLLIIDEAGKLSPNLILDLHDLRNATIQNAGIVMAGCEYFHDNMRKAADRQKQGFPEFYSRVMNWNILNPPTRQEIEAISQSNGVTDPDTIKAFQRLKNFRDLYNSITNETSSDN